MGRVWQIAGSGNTRGDGGLPVSPSVESGIGITSGICLIPFFDFIFGLLNELLPVLVLAKTDLAETPQIRAASGGSLEASGK